MERIKRSASVRLMAVLALAFMLSTWIDPHLGYASPLAAQAVNAVIPLVVMLLVWALSGRAWFALLIEAILLGVMGYADHLKMENLDTDLVYADFTVLGGLLRDPRLVLGFVPVTPVAMVAGAAALLALMALFWFSRRWPRASWRFRLGCAVAGALAALAIWNYQAPDVVAPLQWEVFGQASGADSVGVAGNVMLGRMTTRAVNRKADPLAERAFWNEPLVREARLQVDGVTAGAGVRPDIVIIQSESLFEPSQLKGFADRSVLAHVSDSLPGSGGGLQVPVFGGRTLQTEFEMLTGVPVAFYPGSMFAYYDLVNHRIDALPHLLGDLGYRTVAMHPNDRGFWRRGVVMPEMGFDTFQDIGSFLYPRDFSERQHVSDAALTRGILAVLDATTAPTFITAVTMDNHGPWGDFAPHDDSVLHLPAASTGVARAQLADYVARAIDADKAYGFLLDALQRRARPTIVLIYGDHLPALPLVYSQLGFKDGKPPEQHLPPYRVWANFPVPTAPGNMSSYLLQGWLLRAARLPLRGQGLANALAGMVAGDTAVSEADRQRVLDEYANVAAGAMSSIAPRRGRADKFFVGQARALDLLLKSAVQPLPVTVATAAGDLRLNPESGGRSTITFAVDSRLATLVLRPYVGASTARCLTDNAADRGEVIVDADGHTLYRAALNPQIMRLGALDLRSVKRLALTVTGDTETGACRDVYIRVAQMQCYSANCDVPRPGPPAGPATHSPSRILTDDPARGDMPALAKLMSAERQQTIVRGANMRWLLRHEISRQQGFSPITVAEDARLFMPPADDHPAAIEFDVSGVDTLVLTPRINPLSDECKALNEPGKEGGVAGLTVTLDGVRVHPRVLVDRTHAARLPIAVAGHRDLRIEVDKGNSVSWCDWVSVGVEDLDGPAVSALTGASPALAAP